MTRLELIELLEKRRLDIEEARRSADRIGSLTAYEHAFGRTLEIDHMIQLLRTNLINGD